MMLRTPLAAAAAVAAAVGFAATASADTGGYSGSDQTFYRLLTHGKDPITVSNFPLLVAQGQDACNALATGSSTLDAVHRIQAEGPYSFATANTIVSAAGVSYCLPDLERAQVVDCERAQREGAQVDCDALRRSAIGVSN